MMKKLGGIIVCFLLITTSCFVVGADTHKDTSLEEPQMNTMVDEWPMFHHDAQHTGYSSSIAPNTDNILWTYNTLDTIHYSSPAVANGRGVYWM